VLGLLYDIHGNLPALEAVLAEAEDAGVDRWLLGGDYGTPSPWPLETLDRLRQLEDATWIRGNGERWLREPPLDRPEVMAAYDTFQGGLPDEVADWLYGLPTQVELDGVLYVHGSPLSDVDSFAPEPQDDEERLLAGVRDRLVVFGHTHPPPPPPTPAPPPNPPPPAAWALRDDDGEFAFRRTEYDAESAAAAYRRLGGDFGELVSNRIVRGSD
jgi:predicted phosphodiesterase